ncbi:MAG: metallophosphoesterase [Actinomycetota bacterium]
MGLIFAFLAIGAAVWAVVIERHWFAVRRYTVACLPPDAASLRILHVSDLHFRRGQGLKRRFLRSLSGERLDLIVGTGDFLGDKDSVEATAAALEPIKARLGGLFVLGSNDYFSPVFKNPLRYFAPKARPHRHGKSNPWPDLVQALVGIGWNYLSNRSTQVDGIEVVGLDDAHIGRADPDAATQRSGPGFRLALAHTPDSARDLLSKGYDLVLCGHTHGGQVRLPGSGPLVTNCDIPREWARGLHEVDGNFLHVSAGLGTSMYAPYRFACRPEVSILELVPRVKRT